MSRDIIFYAPLGRGIPAERLGGAEAGCLRTRDIYSTAGYNVIRIDKPMRLGSTAAYAASAILTYLKYVRALLAHPDALVHIVGFYDKIIDIEYTLLSTARALGHKTVYELRNGGMIRIYAERGPKYQRRQLQLLAKATGVLCQGICYVDFIRKHLGRESMHYPNFLADEYLKPWQPHDMSQWVKLIYFGRIAPSKNIDAVIRCAALVRKRYPMAHLDIVGAVDSGYMRYLQSVITGCGLPAHSVTFHGHQSLDAITRLLYESHFFVFPSAEPNEGHSNSLTEAMGCGVVPVVSTAGFNADICGIPELVLDTTEPEAYATAIIGILDKGRWEELSRRAFSRVESCFTKSIVAKRLIDYISSL